jgi:glycine cleavage system H protein
VEIRGCPLPEDALLDADGDVWVREGPEGGFRLGITSALSAFAGRFVSLRYRSVGPEVHAGESLATIESFRYTGPIRVPVEGRILGTNAEAAERPRMVNDSPYDLGWIARFAPRRPADLDRLARAEAARERFLARIEELHVRCEGPVPDVEVVELGTECSAVLARLDEEIGRREPGEILRLVTDDPTSPIEMIRWQDRSGHTLLGHSSDGPVFRFLVRREANPVPRRRSPISGRI